MSLLVVGTGGAVAGALGAADPPARADAIAAAVAERQPGEVAIIALPAAAGPLGAASTEALAAELDRTVTAAFAAVRAAGALGHPVRVAAVCPAGGVLPDHRDGVRSVAAAGVAMLGEICAASPTLTVNVIAVADDVPADEVAAVVRFALSDAAPHLNGAIIRLDGGRDAVLAAQTRAEGD